MSSNSFISQRSLILAASASAKLTSFLRNLTGPPKITSEKYPELYRIRAEYGAKS